MVEQMIEHQYDVVSTVRDELGKTTPRSQAE